MIDEIDLSSDQSNKIEYNDLLDPNEKQASNKSWESLGDQPQET